MTVFESPVLPAVTNEICIWIQEDVYCMDFRTDN